MKRRPRAGRWLHRLTLQGRFAVFAALAVSVAVCAAVVISYFLVKEQLQQQVDSQLNRPPMMFLAEPGGGQITPAEAFARCQPGGSPLGEHGGGHLPFQSGPDPQGGTACASASGGVNYSDERYYNLGPTASAQQIAVADGSESNAFYDTYTTDGTHVRVHVEPLSMPGSGASGYSVSFITPLTHMDDSLHSLAIVLSLGGLGGIILASAAGFLVARSALKPVRRLTKAVEHVAATDDLSVQLPVDGADELSRLGRAFNRMTRSLAGSRERQKRLIADAGHELRTPLTSLRTNVDLLLRARRTGRELPEGREGVMLESIDQQLHELSGLVTDLLELSRNAEGIRRTMRVPLHESVQRAVERAKLRGPGLSFDVEIEPWFVQGDPTGLDRAVVNLLDNAVKFSPPAGRVTVRLQHGEYSVRDQGPGIAPADLPRVFERFYRSDSARSLPGSGLGLAIVAQVADESGGSIRLESPVGGGTLARLTLPGDSAQGP